MYYVAMNLDTEGGEKHPEGGDSIDADVSKWVEDNLSGKSIVDRAIEEHGPVDQGEEETPAA